MAFRPYLAHPPVALAHRGGSLYEPNIGLENTMTAFRAAVEMGYTHLETDVHATKDGRLVAFHDSSLDRVADRPGRIRDLTWHQVRDARIQRGEHVPLLTEILDAFPGIYLNIDLKAPHTAGLLWEIIEHRGLHDRVCVGSFSPRNIAEFRRMAGGQVTTAAAPIGTALAVLGPRWLTSLAATPADVFQVPVEATYRGRTVRIVTPKLVELAHARDKQVHVWTIDDAAEMHRLLDLGVDGLVSDRIDVLKDVLTARGTWTGTA